ncbi:MAG: hypothetical protein B7Z73_17600 [Planctomycetia bacterium 21-64-5]|nr:MAG: hypothetical protein B7Z73_17600 [Planctomycetia bacterium 21-64-5]
MTRKDALKRLTGLAPRVDDHLERLAANPTSRDRPHWTGEIRNWIRQMEALLPAVGGKTAEKWRARIAEWKARLES